MALCSSSRNPVSLFSKHLQGDRSLQRDRLVLTKGVGRNGLREFAYTGQENIEKELAHFNDRQRPLAPYETQHMILSLDAQQESREINSSLQHARNPWITEYCKNGPHSRGRPTLNVRTGQFPQSQDSKLSMDMRLKSRSGGCARQDTVKSAISQPHQQYRAQQSFQFCRMATGPPVHSTPEVTIGDSDWEAVFSQLEKANELHDEALLARGIQRVEEQHVEGVKKEVVKSVTFQESAQEITVHHVPEYVFQLENQYTSSDDPFTKGMDIVRREGNLSLAVLAFEAACQQEPQNAAAWRMLGTMLADNEQEARAAKALQEAFSLDPDNPDVMLQLAVCYTNNGNAHGACDVLEEWLKIKYPEIIAGGGALPTELSDRYGHLKRLYISAAQLCPTGSNMDANVQIALGILFYSTREYQEAADCFGAAIACTTDMSKYADQMHHLYNHYGACLGNMSQHDEAIAAYNMALKLQPNYSRARYNLGMAYCNASNPREGARQFLRRLRTDMMQIVRVGTSHGRLQEVGADNEDGSVMQDVYAGLKSCCFSMCRWDLAALVGPGMDLRAFEMAVAS